MGERIDLENLDSEFYNFGDNFNDANNVTICISNASVGIPDEKKPESSLLPKRMKKYEILNPLPDKESEKKRQDAIKSKNNRDKVKYNQKVKEKELAKGQILIKSLERELQLQKANHGKEIAECKQEIAEGKQEIAEGKREIAELKMELALTLRDKTISDLQHRIEFDEFVRNSNQNL